MCSATVKATQISERMPFDVGEVEEKWGGERGIEARCE